MLSSTSCVDKRHSLHVWTMEMKRMWVRYVQNGATLRGKDWKTEFVNCLHQRETTFVSDLQTAMRRSGKLVCLRT